MTVKWYITFGQAHAHSINGKTFDKDCVAVIYGPTAKQCDEWAFEWFAGEFHGHSAQMPPMQYYPRGLIDVNPPAYEARAALEDK